MATVGERLSHLLELAALDDYNRSMDLQAAWSGHLDQIATEGVKRVDEVVEIYGDGRAVVIGHVEMKTYICGDVIRTDMKLVDVEGEKIEETPAPKPRSKRLGKTKIPDAPVYRYAACYDRGDAALVQFYGVTTDLKKVLAIRPEKDDTAYIVKTHPDGGGEKIYIWVDEWVEFDDPDFIPF